MDDAQRSVIRKEFGAAVNMTPKQLADWLETEESRSVGAKESEGGESVGHESGRRIVAIKGKRQAELSDADYEHMRRVVGYVHRHVEQGGPEADKRQSRWRYSLMNWGHDPLK